MARADDSHLVARNRPDTIKMPEERTRNLARVDVPQFDRVVEAARNEQLLMPLHLARQFLATAAFRNVLCGAAVVEGEQLQALHLAPVARKLADACAERQVPETHCAVVGCGK